MKRLCAWFIGLGLVFAMPLHAKEPKNAKQLNAKALAKIAAAVSRVADKERALQAEEENGMLAEDAQLKPVLDAMQTAQEQIQKKMDFPQGAEDATRAGMIFQSLLSVMDSYNTLRATQADLSKTAGYFIATQQFVSRDGQFFTIESFIQQFLATVQSQKLAQNLADFKDHLREDAA